MKPRFYPSAALRAGSPAVGRFLQPDSIVPEPGNPQSFNRYSYVLNNPVRYTDPTGRLPWDPLQYCLVGIGCPGAGPNLTDPILWSDVCQSQGTGICLSGPQGCWTWTCFWKDVRKTVQAVGEISVSAAPITGDILDICTGLTGKDCLRWQDVPAWQRALFLPSLFSPIGFARYSDESIDATKAVLRAEGTARSLDDVLKAPDRDFRRFIRSLEGEAARAGQAPRSVEDTNRILDEAYRRGWRELDVAPHQWVGGAHKDLLSPDRQKFHFPIPEDFNR